MAICDIFCPMRNFFGGLITAHESDAGNHRSIAIQESGQEFGIQFLAYIFPEVLAMTSGAMTRTPGEVERERHLSGNLLKNDVKGCNL